MAFRESTQGHEISGEKEKDTREKENILASPSLFMSSKVEVTEWCIWESEMMLPWTSALRLPWRLPFWKGWDLRRLICRWITRGDFWLARGQPGQTAAVSGDRGLKQMAWLNQGKSAVLGARLCALTWVRDSVVLSDRTSKLCVFSLFWQWRPTDSRLCHWPWQKILELTELAVWALFYFSFYCNQF